MAKDLTITYTCDLCDGDGMHNVPAIATHVLAMNGGPDKELDLCPRDTRDMERLFRAYEENGREVARKEPAPVKKKAKAVQAEQPKELEDAPSAVEEKTPGKVWCPLPHTSENGTGKFVVYESRGQHAKTVHDGLQVWDVEWMDPHKILEVPCTTHAQCKEKGLAFTSKHGLTAHITKCPLPRIDTSDDKAADKTPDD